MAFSDQAKLLLPFMSPVDSVLIDSTILHLKSHGITNGNYALTRVCEVVDSLKLPQRMHVIIATDGIFNITEETKNYVDSILNLHNTSFYVMQFGNRTNADLEELSVRTPQGKYVYVNKHTVAKFMDEQKPEKMPDPNTVLYTKMDAAIGSKLLQEIIEETK